MHDELVKQLRYCAETTTCRNCPWIGERCLTDMKKQAADAIEELSARLEAHNEWFAKADRKIEEYKAAYIAEHDARIAEVSKTPRWITVEERLPEIGQYVLCLCRANIFCVLRRDKDGDWYENPAHVYMSKFVTHWMPLPEPPKEET